MAKKINLHKNTKTKNKSKSKKDNIDTYKDQVLHFVNKYKAYLSVVLLILSFIPLYFFIVKPKCRQKNEKAMNEIFKAVYHFEKKEYDKALEGDDSFKGFNQILKEYPKTKTAQLVNFYVGVINLNKKNYELAITNFKKFKTKDLLLRARSLSLIGDAYSQLGKYKKAIKYYNDASKEKSNKIYSPKYLIKSANMYLKLGEKKNALKCYKKIKKDYPKSIYSQNAEKMVYILS